QRCAHGGQHDPPGPGARIHQLHHRPGFFAGGPPAPRPSPLPLGADARVPDALPDAGSHQPPVGNSRRPGGAPDHFGGENQQLFRPPPTFWISLLNHPDFNRRDLTSSTKGYYGASIMPVPVLTKLKEALPRLSV